jgi:Ice-binding-like
MRLRALSILVLVFVLPLLAVSAYADTAGIGAAGIYGVLGMQGVTNVPALGTVINGFVGGGPGSPTVTGFGVGLGVTNPPGSINLNAGATAFTNAGTAFTIAAAAATGFGSSALGFGTLGTGGSIATLLAGNYNFNAATSLTGILTLDAGGSNSASWNIFVPTQLTTFAGSSVQIINAGTTSGVFNGSITWAVGNAVLGTTTSFLGTIIGGTGNTLANAATIGCGRVISLTASVTLSNNTVTLPGVNCQVNGTTGTVVVVPPTPGTSSVPEPGTFALLSSGLALGLLKLRKSH